MPDPTLFHGIAIVIDDAIDDASSGIAELQAQIEKEGCHVVGMKDIPDDKQLNNLKTASFFLVDWNLYGEDLKKTAGDVSITIPDALKESNATKIIEFLKKLKSIRFAPVFIFTDELVDEIREQLSKHPELYDEGDPSHILVESKAKVRGEGVFSVLKEWLLKAPSAYVLKRWESEYERAKNELFIDFYGKSVLWPLILWKNFESDGAEASIELGNLIARNLLSRMTPFDFDLSHFGDALKAVENDKDKYRQILLRVLEGERFVPNKRLHSNSIAPGDVFKKGGKYYVNIRPDCDCVVRNGAGIDSLNLYLLRGDKLKADETEERYSLKFGNFREIDSEAVVFSLADGVTVVFQFKDLRIETWGVWKEKRVGRLLPPYLTRLQERYSAYLQRPGLTRIPKAAIAFAAVVSAPDVATADARPIPQPTEIPQNTDQQPAAAPAPLPEGQIVKEESTNLEKKDLSKE